MKRLLSCLVLTALSAVPGMALQNTDGIVEGHVVRADTSEPIRDAQIKLRKYVPAGIAETEESTTSDGNGLFHFEHVSAGSYLAEVRHDGYFGLFFGSTLPWFQTDITVPPRQSLRDLTFPMLPGGALSGSVVDLNGQPEARVMVSLIRLAYGDGGEAQLINERQVVTDARGDYSFSVVPPGKHYLRAGGSFNPSSSPATTLLLSYFPGTPDFSQAKPIEIAPAKETFAADIKLQAIPMVSVSGRILFPVPPGPQIAVPDVAARMSFTLVPLDPAVARNLGTFPFENVAQDRSNGQFQIRGVPPGIYDLAATFSNGSSDQVAGHSRIEVAGSDLKDVELAAYPAVDLKGRIVTNGDASALAAMARTFMNIWPVLNGHGGGAEIDSQGNFKFPSVADGTYRLVVPMRLTAFGQLTCLTDMRQGARSIAGDGIITVEHGQAEPVELHITSSCGIVTGRVTDNGAVVGGALVVLVPTNTGLQNPMLRRMEDSNPEGEFTIPGVPPGRYKLFAWQPDPTGEVSKPDFILKHDSIGKSVVVSPAATSQIQLELFH